ncbi:MAG TPA: tetratricopeptide repeat protein [Methylomirabilota bacterium]|nr:tetratricopeptide repeat protein [Methylomirabilota bacterium]
MTREAAANVGLVGARLRRPLFCVALLALVAWLGSAPLPAGAQPPDIEALLERAIGAYEAKRYEEALGLLAEVLAREPENVDALYYQGLALIAQQKFPQAVEPLEKARALNPEGLAIAYQLGVAYFALERYDKAEPLLTQVLRRRPDADGVGYYVGFMRYRRGEYRGALEAFKVGRSEDPNIQQLTRLYSGLSLAVLGLRERAVTELERALRAQSSALTGPAERLRDTLLAARDVERRFQAEVRLGFLYDDNVPVLPAPSHDPAAESVRPHRSASIGELAGVRFDYAWLRTGPWEATLTYSFLQTIYNDLPSFNLQDHLGGAGLTYRGVLGDTVPYQLGTRYEYDYLTLGGDEFVQRHTASLFATAAWNTYNLTTLQARLQVKEFSHDTDIPPEEVRDADNWLVGLLHVFRFESDRHFIRLGYQFDLEDASGRNWKYHGHRILAGAQYTLPWGDTRLRYDYDVHFRNYRHAHTILPITAPGTRERADIEQVHVARIEQPLPWSLTLSLEYQGIASRSNLPLFSYNRSVYSLILSWQY